MNYNMLKEALSEVKGLLNQLFTNICGNDGEAWLEEFKKFLRKEPCWVVTENTVKKITNKLLTPLGLSVSPATTEKFVAKENFVVDISETAKVRISSIGSNFSSWFLDKIEESKPETTLRGSKLLKLSIDKPIIVELGGEDVVETTLQDIWNKVAAQAKGEKGDLLTNGWANIFYVRDITGTLRAVRVNWFDVGWSFEAHSVKSPVEWIAGCQVFSRNFETQNP